MSEFKSSRILMLVLIAFIVIDGIISYYLMKGKTENSIHSVSLYTAEGDTLLDLDTRSEEVKIWIEENGELDVWTLEENGWRRR